MCNLDFFYRVVYTKNMTKISREALKHKVKAIFGDLDNFSTKGLNGEEEFLDAIVETIVAIGEYGDVVVNINDLPDKEKFEQTRKRIIEKQGGVYTPRETVSLSTVYIVRLFMHAQNANIFDDFTPDELKYITINGGTTNSEEVEPKFKNTIFNFIFNRSDRETRYPRYKDLSYDQQLKFKQELRKKVIAHEFFHAASGTKERAYWNVGSMPIEEILVERVALDSQKIYRKIPYLQTINDKYLVKFTPNIESSNSSIYSVGQFLSSIFGEGELQKARLVSKKDLMNLFVSNGFTQSEVLIIEYLCAASTNEDVARDYLTKLGYEFPPELSDKELTVYAQLEVEKILAEKYVKIAEEKLKTPNLTREQMKAIYAEYYALIRSILTSLDKNAPKTPAHNVLYEYRQKIDERCTQLGYDINEIKREVTQEIQKIESHYITTDGGVSK